MLSLHNVRLLLELKKKVNLFWKDHSSFKKQIYLNVNQKTLNQFKGDFQLDE